MEIYKLKEKLRLRDRTSTLPDMDDMAFLKDLGLIIYVEGTVHLTIAGLLFVGKKTSIKKFLPQAEVIYLKYKDTFNKLGYKTKINTHTTSCINLFLDIYLYSEYRLIYC